MSVLTVKDLKAIIKNMPDNTVVIIGDDDELNGVHNAWYVQAERIKDLEVNTFGERSTRSGVILYDPEYPDMAFDVHLGQADQKINEDYVLLIS